MGACQANDNRLIKVLLLEKHYPQFHLRNFSEDKILSYLKENEQEVWEYYNKFNQNKEELKKTNKPSLRKRLAKAMDAVRNHRDRDRRRDRDRGQSR